MTDNHLIPQPFLDWYGIWPGAVGYDNDRRSWLQDAPRGVCLKVQAARKTELFFRRERPWEQDYLGSGHILFEDGLYRMWYSTNVGMCYAKSTDGFHWERPEFRLYEFKGSTANNILCDNNYLSLHSIFRDPVAPDSERYKAIDCKAQFYRHGLPVPYSPETKQQIRELRKALELKGYTPEEIDKEAEFRFFIRGAVSPDGLRWTVLEKPLIDLGKMQADTQNIACYDEEKGEYVAYLRGHVERRRAVRRTGGPTFGGWHEPRMVLLTDPQDPPDEDLYTTVYCRCPGSKRHLMFPSVFHRTSDTLDIQISTSRDGWNWSRPERKPIITRETESEGHLYGSIYAFANLVPLNDEEWGLAYVGYYRRHNDWDEKRWAPWEPDGGFRWAVWKRDRLVALEAPVEGQVTLVERICQGKQVLLNYQTEPGGWIQVALVYTPTTPPTTVEEMKDYGLNDCDVLAGDELARVVTWKGNGDLSSLKGRKVSLRIRMDRAKLFSVAI